jgi:hypothetical protein
VKVVVAKKGTPSRPKLKFMRIIWAKIGPARTPKHVKVRVVGISTEKKMEWSIIIKEICRGVVDEMSGGKKGLIPILQGHGGLSKQRKAHFHDVTMLAFSDAILIVRVWAGD